MTAPEIVPPTSTTRPPGVGGTPAVKRHSCPDCRCPERAAAECAECGHPRTWHDTSTKRAPCSWHTGPKGTPCGCPGLRLGEGGE